MKLYRLKFPWASSILGEPKQIGRNLGSGKMLRLCLTVYPWVSVFMTALVLKITQSHITVTIIKFRRRQYTDPQTKRYSATRGRQWNILHRRRPLWLPACRRCREGREEGTRWRRSSGPWVDSETPERESKSLLFLSLFNANILFLLGPFHLRWYQPQQQQHVGYCVVLWFHRRRRQRDSDHVQGRVSQGIRRISPGIWCRRLVAGRPRPVSGALDRL